MKNRNSLLLSSNSIEWPEGTTHVITVGVNDYDYYGYTSKEGLQFDDITTAGSIEVIENTVNCQIYAMFYILYGTGTYLRVSVDFPGGDILVKRLTPYEDTWLGSSRFSYGHLDEDRNYVEMFDSDIILYPTDLGEQVPLKLALRDSQEPIPPDF